MANIKENLNKILTARYGKDVRQSIHDGIEEGYEAAVSAQDSATKAANTAISKATEATEAAQQAIASAEEAKQSAESAFSGTPGGYDALVGDVALLKEAIVQTSERTLEGSKAGGIKLIGVKGASEQAVYSGKQLLPPIIASSGNGVTLSYDEEGYMVLNGTAAALTIFSQYFDTDLSLGTYTLSANNEKKADTTIQCTISDSKLSVDVVRVNLNDATTTTTKVTTEVGKRWAIVIPSGTVLENYRLRPQLEVGEVATPWEPYTGNAPSPSPSYPQPIKSVGDSGSLVIEQRGKNLYNPFTDIKGTISQDGVFTTSEYYLTTDYIKVNGTMAFSGIITGDVWLRISLYDENKNFIKRTDQPIYEREIILSFADVDARYIRVSFESYDAKYITDFQVEYNRVITAYEPYHSNTITILLNEPLRKGDEIAVVDGVWGVNRNTPSAVFDGSEDYWYASSAVQGRYTISLPNAKSLSLCTQAIVRGSETKVVNECYLNTQGAFCINTDFETLEEWKEHLASNPIEVEYELATPVFEPFADQTPFYGLKSYDTVTYISTDSKVEPSIEVKFGRTEGDALVLAEYNRNCLQDIAQEEAAKLNEQVFQSVSNGKALIASAITGKGTYTDATATFEAMANNIAGLPISAGVMFTYRVQSSGAYCIVTTTVMENAEGLPVLLEAETILQDDSSYSDGNISIALAEGDAGVDWVVSANNNVRVDATMYSNGDVVARWARGSGSCDISIYPM